MSRRHITAASRSAFTFVELMVAVVIFGLVASSAIRLLFRGSGVYRTGVTISDVEARTARALERMVREISSASAGSLDPPDPAGGAQLEFVTPQGVAGTTVLWGPTLRYAVEPMTGELDNGVDDNGNGLVDEGALVRTEDPGGPDERRVVLVTGVAALLEGELANGVDDNGNGLADEGGLAITIQDGGGMASLTLRLTLQAIGPSGEVVEHTLDTIVGLRN